MNNELLANIQTNWNQLRDTGSLNDTSILDILLSRIGMEGSPGYDCGIRSTFSVFPPNIDAELILPTGEKSESDEDARFIAHILALRLFLGAGLGFESRIVDAIANTYGLSWTKKIGGNYECSKVALANSIWLIALDPKPESDIPLDIDWSLPCFQNEHLWDKNYNLFSRYDIKERMLDWLVYMSADEKKLVEISIFSFLEPIIRMKYDSRVKMILSKFSKFEDYHHSNSAVILMEKKRILNLLIQKNKQ